MSIRIMRVESEFRRDAKHWPIKERNTYGSLLLNLLRLDRGPRILLFDLLGPVLDKKLMSKDELRVQQVLNYYQGKSNPAELILTLKFLSTHYLEMARRENDSATQVYLLFKAVDLARMIVQYTPYSVHADSEALILGIFTDLGNADNTGFAHYAQTQDVIYKLMKTLQVMPTDIPARMRLAETLTRQSSYYDALVQYQMVLRIFKPSRGSQDKFHGLVFARIGELLQKVADVEPKMLRDGQKLKNFITRYNKDYPTGDKKLPSAERVTAALIDKVQGALIEESTQWQVRASDVAALERFHRLSLISKAAQNYMTMNNPKAALHLLQQGYHLWHRVAENGQTLNEKAAYLQLLVQSASLTKNREVMGWAAQFQADVRGKLNFIEKAEKERLARRAEMLG